MSAKRTKPPSEPPQAPQILAAVFDLGGVIIDVHEQRPPGLWAASAGVCERDVARLYHNDTQYKLLACGKISMADYHRHIADRIGGPLSFEQFVDGWNAVLGGPLPGAQQLIAQLAGHVRLIVLSNTTACHTSVWSVTLADVLTHFERLFLSHEMGVRKPQPGSFRCVLDYLDLPPEQVAMIDDKPENISAAEALGMKGIVARGAESISRGLAELGLPADPERG